MKYALLPLVVTALAAAPLLAQQDLGLSDATGQERPQSACERNPALCPVKIIAPRYPESSRKQKQQGETLVRVVIGTNGLVENAIVVRSSGFELLDQAALEAVHLWQWEPYVRDGKAIQVMGVIRVPFVLRRRSDD